MRRCVAQVAAFGDLCDEGIGGDNRGGSQSDLLCQGTPVGSKASQPVPPRGVDTRSERISAKCSCLLVPVLSTIPE